jgi:hypothetical protein
VTAAGGAAPTGARVRPPGGARVDLGRVLHWLVVAAVVCTPLFNAGEVIALVRGLVTSQAIAYTPTYVKALKDVFVVLIALVATATILATGRTHRLMLPFLAGVLYIAGAAATALSTDARLAVAGLRWALPLCLPFLLAQFVDAVLLGRLARVLARLLVVHVVAQVVQLFVMGSWFGINAFGLAARVPGIFFIPSTAGFFAVTTLYFALFHLPRGRLRTATFLLAPVSVVLTQSGTGLGTLLLVATLLVVGPRRALLLVPAAPLLAFTLLSALPILTGRGDDYVGVSGGTRVAIFSDMLDRFEWFPSAFGHATNTAVNFGTNFDRADGGSALGGEVVDSTYASILGNLGLLGFGVCLVAFGLWGIVLLRTQRRDLYAFTLIVSLYAATTIIPESFPMGLLVAVVAAYYLRTVFIPALFDWRTGAAGAVRAG